MSLSQKRWPSEMPIPLRGGEVAAARTRRPLPPPRCAQREMVSTPSGCAPSVAPARVRRAEFPTGSLVELHENIVDGAEPPTHEVYEEVEVTFTEMEEDPTQRMQRRSSVPQAPNPFARRPRELELARRPHPMEIPVRESTVLPKEPRAPLVTIRQEPSSPEFDARRRLDPQMLDPHALDPQALDPRALDPRGLRAVPRIAPEPRTRPPRAPAPPPDPHDSVEGCDRPATIPEPPRPEPMVDMPISSPTPVLPALRVAIYTAKDGTPQLALHQEGEVVGAPTAVLVPDCREDALRIVQMFKRAEAESFG